MISGSVQGSVPIVPLTLEDRSGGFQQFRFAVDTGFNGFLSLPPADLQRLGFTAVDVDRVILADGSEVESRVYTVAVYWHDHRREVLALESVLPLLGMRLLNGSRIGIDVAEGGPVSVEPL